jgi:hypothetical protein
MSEQPPVQPPVQPPSTPPHQPPNQPEGNPPTQPMTAAFGTPPAAPTAASVPAYPPTTNRWQRATSTTGRRWALVLSAAAVALLLVVGIGVTSLLVLRNHDRVNVLGDGQTARNFGQYGPGNGNGQGPLAQGRRNGRNLPGLPGGRVQGLRGLENLLGGTALHGDVTANAAGSVQALVFQHGEVSALSATSITLKSSDGFTGTYGLNATTGSSGASLVKGGQAFVLARASDKVAITTLAMPAPVGSAPST